jgi:uncharacterized DUF497 family protein
MATIVEGDFEWDDLKAAGNPVAHDGVTFQEAALALAADPNEIAFPDRVDPSRTLSLVLSPRDRVLLVVTTEASSRTRIISARKADPHEHRIYFEGSSP